MKALIDTLDAFLREAQVLRRERMLRALRPGLEAALARGFRRQGAVFMAMLARRKADWQPEAQQLAFDWGDDWRATAERTAPALVNPLVRYIKLSLVAGGNSLYRDLALVGTFGLKHPSAVRYLEQHGAELVSRINAETERQLRTLLTRGADQGWSYDKLAAEINARFDGFAEGRPQQHIDSRAHLVAVTELGNAYETGNYLAGQELRDAGLVMEKAWQTVEDERVCSEECEANQAQGWIPFDEPFSSGHLHPLAHPACRCTLLQRRRPGAW